MAASSSRTLEWAIGLSLGAHLALFGFHAIDPSGFARTFKDTPLDVILVNARANDAAMNATAVAQSAMAGGGDQASGRSTSPLPGSAQNEMGNATDETHRRVDQLQEEQQQRLAQVRREMALLPPPDAHREAGTPQEREQEERRRQLLKLLAEIEKRINDDSAQPRKRYVSPATREVAYAVYYDKLRRRIEDRGTRDFPQHQGRKLYGELTMTITINSAGKVVESEILRSSGNPILDKHALLIVRAAAPYGQFSTEMRREADQIVVPSRFRFTREDGLEATLTAAPTTNP